MDRYLKIRFFPPSFAKPKLHLTTMAERSNSNKAIHFEAEVATGVVSQLVWLPQQPDPQNIDIPMEQQKTVSDIRDLIYSKLQFDSKDYNMVVVNGEEVIQMNDNDQITVYFKHLEGGYVTFQEKSTQES
ncbi:hypothetical protein Btru_071817 [Bulinus truncatus]|nr:hypothetical protein Btru_071817 [Bulinus truncatus]